MPRKPVENKDLYPLLVANILAVSGLSQAELARRSGKTRGQIHDWLRGNKTPRPASLQALIAGVPLPATFAREALPHMQGVRAAAGLVAGAPGTGEQAAEVAAQLAEPVAQSVLTEAARRLSRLFAEEKNLAAEPRPPAPEDRQEAERLWQAFGDLPAADLKILVENLPELQTWAFAERLAHESERSAAGSAGRALELADLAVCAARRIRGEDFWRSRVEGYAWAFAGNARRVANASSDAEAAFAEHERLWGPAGADPAGLLEESRVVDLKASLRRDQRQFEEALRLHARALALCPPAERPSILLNQSATQEQKGDPEAALATLREAAPLVDGERQPRLLFALRFNLAVLLFALSRPAEAEPLLAEVRDLVDRIDTHLDRIRLRWLEARIAAGLGRAEEAIARLREVQDAFIAEKLPYETALATLDLAGLLAGRGETAEVQALARHAAPVFAAQGVDREALACFLLFQEAAERETVTAALAHSLAERLRQGG